MRPVAPIVAGRRPQEMRHGLQSQYQLRRLDVGTLDIQVVRPLNLGALQFGPAHEQVDKLIREGEARFPHVCSKSAIRLRII